MKPGTFTQLHIQLVFAVKYRECLLHRSQRVELFKYTSGILENNKWFKGKFAWQDGDAAFSYGHSQIHDVYLYIFNQETHHAIRPFREEYLELLRKFELKYDDRYLFEFFE